MQLCKWEAHAVAREAWRGGRAVTSPVSKEVGLTAGPAGMPWAQRSVVLLQTSLLLQCAAPVVQASPPSSSCWRRNSLRTLASASVTPPESPGLVSAEKEREGVARNWGSKGEVERLQPVANARSAAIASCLGTSPFLHLPSSSLPSSLLLRPPSPPAGEVDGEHYHFAPKEDILAQVAEGKFLEHALVHGNVYGTSFEAINSVSDRCRICILDIDVQGVKSCKSLKFDAGKYVFIAPPSLELLEARLRARGTETEESIKKRMSGAVRELEEAKHIAWDAYIVNDDLKSSYAALKAVTEKDREACRLQRESRKAAAGAAAGGQ